MNYGVVFSRGHGMGSYAMGRIPTGDIRTALYQHHCRLIVTNLGLRMGGNDMGFFG
jgi:hypothetical protein